MSRGFLIALVLSASVVLVYGQSYCYEFTTWDDTRHIVDNESFHPVTIKSIAHFWNPKHPYFGLYIPFTYTLWAAQAKIAELPVPDDLGNRLNPYVFHVTNIALHLLNVLLVWVIIRRLIENDWAACAGALLFAVHPMQAETVVWISGMRDLLAGLLSLLAIWQFLKCAAIQPTAVPHEKHRTRRWLLYGSATLCFVLALLSKPASIVVPAIVWVLACWKYRRPMTLALMLLPWAIMSCLIVVIAKSIQTDAAVFVHAPALERPLIAADAFAFYLYKLVAPIHLGIDYGRTPQRAMDSKWIYLISLVPVAIGLAVLIFHRRARWLSAAALIFFLALLPVSGLVLFDFQIYSTVADRYMYFPMVGVALAFAWMLTRVRAPVRWIAAVVLVLLAIRTVFQVPVWEDNISLNTHALEVNRHSWMAHTNLGAELMWRGQYDHAEKQFRLAIAEGPNHWAPYENLGRMYSTLGRRSDAIAAYAQAMDVMARIDMRRARGLLDTRVTIALALAETGKFAEAKEAVAKVLADEPSFAKGFYAQGFIALKEQHLDEALAQFHKALELDPQSALFWKEAGNTLAALNRPPEAIEHFRKSLQLDPKDPEARTHLAIQLINLKQYPSARDELQRVLRANPNYPPARNALDGLNGAASTPR